MHIDKSYFTLPEILERWQITEADLIYLAENDKLRLSVRVFGVPIEFGEYEASRHDGEPLQVPLANRAITDGLARSPCPRRVPACSVAAKLHVTAFGRRSADYATHHGARPSPSSS
jgi:hypothetical protein